MQMLVWNKKQSPEAEPFIRPYNWHRRERGARRGGRQGIPRFLPSSRFWEAGAFGFFFSENFIFPHPGEVGDGGEESRRPSVVWEPVELLRNLLDW